MGDGMKDPIVWRLIRWIYGGYYICLGVASALQMMGVLPEPHWEQYMSTRAATFELAMENTHYLVQFIVLIWIASGVALLFTRTAPLGVALLAPVAVNILLADTLLDVEYLWGAAHTFPLFALAWHYRSAFTGLWNYAPPAKAPETGVG
jgi:hypothetical protein